MSSRLVSILMPAYNGEKFIQQAIESVLAQTHQNWELIVVDDGSTDSTAKIVTAFKDPRILYVYQENQGQAAALNHGLDLARGDYITTLDVDDWFTPHSLRDRVLYLEAHPQYDVVYGDGIYCDVNGNRLKRFSEYRIRAVTGDVYEPLIITPFYGTGGNVMVQKRIFDQYNLRYDESIFWCQDWDIYTRIAEHAAFGCVDSTLIWYRLHENNMTMKPSLREKRLISLIYMKHKVINSTMFSKVSVSGKNAFFYTLLIDYLHGRVDDQNKFLETFQFYTLPKVHRATLLRKVAVNHILREDDPKLAKEWLYRAISYNPIDFRLVLLATLIHLNTNFTKRVIIFWQKTGDNKERFLHPIQMAREAK